MNRDDLRGTLSTLLEEEMGEPYELDDDREIREGLGLDSVDVVGLVMRVEREFRVLRVERGPDGDRVSKGFY